MFQDENVSVYCLHPGGVFTNLSNNSFPTFLWPMILPINEFFFKTPWHGAQTPLYCILDESLGNDLLKPTVFPIEILVKFAIKCLFLFRTENESGEYYEECQKSSVSYYASCEDNQNRLMDISMNMIPMKYFV